MKPVDTSFAAFAEAIRTLTLQTDVPTYQCLPGGFWSVVCLDAAAGKSEHLVTLAWGFPPRPQVRNLACGLTLSEQPRVQEVFRTDARGQFVACLAPGRYDVHYVTELRDRTDIDIWLQLWRAYRDRRALADLERAAERGDTPSDVRRYLQLLLQTIGQPPRIEAASHGGGSARQLPELDEILLAALRDPARRLAALARVGTPFQAQGITAIVENFTRDADPAIQAAAEEALQRLSANGP